MKEAYQRSGPNAQGYAVNEKMQRQLATRHQRKKELESNIKNPKSLISIDGLLDGITALVLDCEPMKKNKNIDNFLSRCNIICIFKIKKFEGFFFVLDGPQGRIILEKRTNLNDFIIIKTIGRGAFGKVQLVILFFEPIKFFSNCIEFFSSITKGEIKR